MFTQRPSRLPSKTISWLIGGAEYPNPHTSQISRGTPNRPLPAELPEAFPKEFPAELPKEFPAKFPAKFPAEFDLEFDLEFDFEFDLEFDFEGPSRRCSTSRSVFGFPREKHCMEERSATSARREFRRAGGMCLKQSANKQGCLPPPM